MRFKFSKKTTPWLVLILGMTVYLILNVTRPDPTAFEVRERIWQVDGIQVQPNRLAPTLTLYGTVGSPNLMKASAPGKSRVTRVLVKEGQRIKEGELLLELDSRDFTPKVNQTKAQIAELEAEISSEITLRE